MSRLLEGRDDPQGISLRLLTSSLGIGFPPSEGVPMMRQYTGAPGEASDRIFFHRPGVGSQLTAVAAFFVHATILPVKAGVEANSAR